MIEGLRLARYAQETRRNGTHVGRESCAPCRERLDVTTRQTFGCVYEEPTTAPARGDVIHHPSLPWGKDDDGHQIVPQVCPLYEGRVAMASDVWGAVPMFRKGHGFLRAWLGREPDRPLLDCLAAHESGENDWTYDENRPKKGGA